MKYRSEICRICGLNPPLCKHCKFVDEIYYNFRDIELLLEDYFLLARPLYQNLS